MEMVLDHLVKDLRVVEEKKEETEVMLTLILQLVLQELLHHLMEVQVVQEERDIGLEQAVQVVGSPLQVQLETVVQVVEVVARRCLTTLGADPIEAAVGDGR